MDLVQQGQLEWIKSGSRSTRNPMLLWTSVISLGFAGSFLVGMLVGGNGARTSDTGVVADPLTQPAAIEFRQGEHAATGVSIDPLTQPGAIEFRQSEREASSGPRSLVDPLTQPAAIEFRQGEKAR